MPALRHTSPTAVPSSPCRRMKAICASENFDLFMVRPRPTARITHAAKLEFSSKDRSRKRGAGHRLCRLRVKSRHFARSHLDRFTPDSVAKLFWAPERATLIQEQRLRRNIDSKIFAPIRLLRVSRLLPSFATESPRHPSLITSWRNSYRAGLRSLYEVRE